MSEETMATILSADCERVDVNFSAGDTNLKQALPVCSVQCPTKSQAPEDIGILKPASPPECSHVVANQFGIDARCSDDEEETELVKRATSAQTSHASPVGDSMQDDDTDLKLVRVAGPTSDRNCTASAGGLQQSKTSVMCKIKSFLNIPPLMTTFVNV